jgi:hypothetical protein
LPGTYFGKQRGGSERKSIRREAEAAAVDVTQHLNWQENNEAAKYEVRPAS